jgi:hypothetical protein
MIPTIKDLVMYVNKALDSVAWNTNFQKIVNWLTSGNYDIKVKNLEISEGGGITNNGSLTQSGNLAVTGDVSATGNLTVGGVISGDGSGLTGVVSAAQISYTPFCVNSGNVDSDGKGDLFKYTTGVSGEIEFKVSAAEGDYKPITFTNAKGKTITLKAINSYDLSQTDNGTYIVYLAENATAVTLTGNGRKIFRQPYAPISDSDDPNFQDPQPSDIWLDTSVEGLKSYIRQSGAWEEADITPLGEVTVNNHKVSSAKTYYFNYNGIGKFFLKTTPKLEIYLEYDNSSQVIKQIIEQWGTDNVVPDGSTITFPVAFSSTPKVVASQASSVNDYYCWTGSKNITTTNFKCRIQDGYGNGNTGTVNWHAKGE